MNGLPWRAQALPCLETKRLTVRLLEPSEAAIMTRFRIQNRAFLQPWEPTRSAEFFTVGFWDMQLRQLLRDFRAGHSMCLALVTHEDGEVAGVCNYTNIVRGTFQACQLGYALAERHQGSGIMFEALTAANRYVFDELGLHRIMAAYLPRNDRSGQLLARLGFEKEGFARDWLQINGRWEDHVLTSCINPASV